MSNSEEQEEEELRKTKHIIDNDYLVIKTSIKLK